MKLSREVVVSGLLLMCVSQAHAVQAGSIARAACVKAAVPFHFSTRYFPQEKPLGEEFERSYRG